jgi:hypothetical protein
MSTTDLHPTYTRIDTFQALREHLQWAIELEHCTLPPYLVALYSLDPVRNPAAVETLTSVFVEEMLHLTLTANLLNAVGGSPVLDSPRLLPAFPRTLPHGDRSFEISLLPFGPEALDTFLRIEKPSRADAPAESDGYETIGQFYEAIRQGLVDLAAQHGEDALFSGDPGRQVTPELAYRGGGHVVPVVDLATALDALDQIVDQGEGTAHHEVWDGERDMYDAGRAEVGHYFRFLELKLGRRFQPGDTPEGGPTGESVPVDWEGVHPMRPNPRTTDHDPDSPVRDAQDTFNLNYCQLLQQLEVALNGQPGRLAASVGTMYALKRQAVHLMQMTMEDGVGCAGPSFEYIDRDLRP